MEMQKTTAVFTFKNIDQFTNEQSKPFTFRGIQWVVQIQRQNTTQIRVFLYIIKADENAKHWSFNASIAFRLIPFSFGRYPPPTRYERSIGAFKFGPNRSSCGIADFISIDELYDSYNQLVQNNTINLEVEINAHTDQVVINKRPPEELKLPIELDEKRFSFSIADISEVLAMVSMPFYIGNIPWQLVISKYKMADTDGLGCHLSIDRQQFKAHEKFTCDVAVQYELQSPKRFIVYSVISDFCTMNASNSYSMPLKHLITLKELFDEKNGFIHNDAIQVEGHFKVKIPNRAMMTKSKRPKIHCPICFDVLTETTTYSTECGHIYCVDCIVNPVKAQQKCTTCGKHIMINKIHPIYLP